MYKLLQILRASRLILLIILLLITIISQLARAETSQLWTSVSLICPQDVKGKLFASAQAVFDACGMADKEGGLVLRREGTNYVACRKGTEGIGNCFATIYQVAKTCEAKELTHNGRFNGTPFPPELHVLIAPKGHDAANWFPNRFNTCENNCIVVNERSELIPGRPSITESDGTSSSTFLKKQTGGVCVLEKQKPDVIKPPKPADDGKPDNSKQPDNGQSGGNPGIDSGNGQGSGNGNTGSSGSDTPPDQNSGNDSSGGGSGGKGGGSSGGGGYTGVPGASPGGSGNGAGKDDGSEGGTDGQGNGKSDGSGEGSDDSGKGSDQKSGDGAVDGDKDGKGDGKGDGEGSISGGNCAAEQAPSCKGDPIQCYIAVEQWRTACATAGKQTEISSGNCKTNTPPECKGDAAQCYIAGQQWRQSCAAAAAQERAESLEEYGKGQQSYLDQLARDGNPDGILDGVKTEKIDLTGKLRTDLIRLGDTCPSSPVVDLGIFGKHELSTDQLCDALRTFGRILLALSYLFAFGIIVRAF